MANHTKTQGVITKGPIGLTLNNPTSNLIKYGNVGTNAPTFSTRSLGTRLLLWDSLTSSTLDTAIGKGSDNMWFSVWNTSESFKWYAGSTTPCATLSGTGNFTTAGSLSAGSISTTGTSSFSGAMALPSGAGSNFIEAGTGDAASYSTYNLAIRSWWGIGFRDYTDSTVVNAVLDCRGGHFSMKGTLTAQSVVQTSDERLKTDIITIDNALNKVMTLRGVEYTRISNNAHEIGVIAQEVQAVVPELVGVSKADDEGYLTVEYGKFAGLFIEAIKELKTEKDAEILALRSENEMLKEQLALIKAHLGL